MMPRVLKQIFVAMIALFFVSAIIYFLFWPEPVEPTCFDGIQNQTEQGIDCGGPCLSCEPLVQKPIETLSAEYILSSENQYVLVAKILNPNPNYGAGNIIYQFDVIDEGGDILGSFTGNEYILRNEKKYVIYQNAVIEQAIGEVNFKILSNDFEKMPPEIEPKLFIRNSNEIMIGLDNTRISGIVKNESSSDFNSVVVKAVVRDKRTNRPILASSTLLKTVLGQEERGFLINWPTPIFGDYLLEIKAETNVFDENNFYNTPLSPLPF